jgi:nitrite reductase/ring-hydroxylating ferredoxin subunit
MTDSELFDETIDRLVEGRSPKAGASALTEEERRMVQMAQLLRGAAEASPTAEFSEKLGQVLQDSRPRNISRRTAVVSGLGALAAGVLAGAGLDRGIGGTSTAAPPTEYPEIVGKNGNWTHVAATSELPDDSVKSFTAGALAGFLVHRRGKITAVSRVCTHMGCLLNYSDPKERLVCPCHGAEFSLYGHLRAYPHHVTTKLPPLPKLRVRVRDGSIQVWTA